MKNKLILLGVTIYFKGNFSFWVLDLDTSFIKCEVLPIDPRIEETIASKKANWIFIKNIIPKKPTPPNHRIQAIVLILVLS